MTSTTQKPRVNTVNITPDLARDMLVTMVANRRVVQSHVATLSDDMRQGRWIEAAGDPIRFDDQDRLIDGQHRLYAILEAGVTLRFTVIKGLPVEAMDILDIGKRRSLADFLAIKGEAHATQLAATITLLRNYWATGEIQSNAWGLRPTTIQEAMTILAEHPGIRDAVQYTRPHTRILSNRTRWATLYFLFAGIEPDDARYFLERVCQGDDLPNNSPIMLLRTRLLSDQHSLVPMRAREYCALAIKAWNSFRKAETPQVLSWRSGGKAPEPFPSPQ